MKFHLAGAICTVILSLGFAAPAISASINIDFGDRHGTPSATFGAASEVAGFWNEINPGITTDLIDADSIDTEVDIAVLASDTGHAALVSGDDAEKLLNDNFFDASAWTVDLTGLADGSYALFVYAPTNAVVSSGIMQINGVAAGELPGSTAGSLVDGTSYSEFPVTVSGGTLSLSGVTSGSVFSGAGLAGLQLASTATQPQSVPVTEDTFANAVKPNRAAGDSTQVAIASWAPKLGFARFDLSALTGIEVDTAVLKLGMQWVKTAGSVGLHLVYSDWDEDTLTYDSMPSFEPIPFATVDVSAADVGNTISVDITEVLQNWLSGSLANYGISLQPAGKVNISLDSKETEGGTPMEIEVTGAPGEIPCPPGTLLEPYTQVCANVNDITGLFLPEAAFVGSNGTSATVPASVREPDIPNLDVLRNHEALKQGLGSEAGELPVPGGTGAGTNYKLGALQALEQSVFHTKMFVQPDGVNPSEPLEWLMTPATNHTDSATEFVGIYASHLVEGGWVGIFGRPCTEAYPCPDGDTSNGWQAGWSLPMVDFRFACHISDIFDQGGHRQKVMHYANETVRLDEGTPPLWRNAIYLWNYCVEEWDLIWRHEYREDKRDCSVEGCYAWGPILETFGTQSEIDELGYEDTLLFHDGRWSPLAPDETNFVNPVSPWILSHIDPNRSYGVGNRFVPAAAPTATLTDDTFANAVAPNRAAGDSTQVAVARWAPKLGFVNFDLSALTGAEVDSASLKLGVQWVKAAGSLGLHLIYSDWDEDTLTYNSMPSFEPIPFATVNVSAADVGNTISVDITGVLRNWISGSLANYGISLQPAGKVNISLDSKETEGGTPIEIETVLAD